MSPQPKRAAPSPKKPVLRYDNGGGVLSPFEFLDWLANLGPPPNKQRHRYHGIFAPNHKRRPAVTAFTIGNIGKRRDTTVGGLAMSRCRDSDHKPYCHDTSRIASAKLMAGTGEEIPVECPEYGGDIPMFVLITKPGPIRKILIHYGEPIEPPLFSPPKGPPTDWGELVQAHYDRAIFQASPDELPVIEIRSL